MFEFDDTTYDTDFDHAWRIRDARSRSAWQLSTEDTDLIVKKLNAIGHKASVRTISTILGCSKPTVMKFLRLGLVQRIRRRTGSRPRGAIVIDVSSVIWFVQLCRKSIRRPPRLSEPFSRLRRRIQEIGPDGSYEMLPRTLSIARTAKFLRCSESTVLRLIEDHSIGHRRTRCRWEIRKSDIPYWCREKR
jgi:excisionase family DNA binding protein